MTLIFGTWGEDGRTLSRPLLREAVRRAWGWTGLPAVSATHRGKPVFDGQPDRWFSLSHSGGYALCALSSAPVGVDIEMVRAHRPGLPAYVLSETELAAFDGSWEDFARMWTLKESWCKREDIPLFPPRRLAVPPPCPYAGYAGRGWRAAVCCHDEPPGEIRWLSLTQD